MKTTLTIEHSAELIRLGVKPERATCIMQVDMPERVCGFRREPVFTIGDLLAMLPKAIVLKGVTYEIRIMWDGNIKQWIVYYAYSQYFGFRYETCSAELIDALYNILVKLIKRKDINPKDL